MSTDVFGTYTTVAAAQGFTVVQASNADWALTPTATFASYRALIIGDPFCSVTPPTAAEGNAADWAAAVDGPVLFIGTDELLHSGQGGQALIEDGIAFVASGTPPPTAGSGAGETGAYVSLSCYYVSAPPATPVPLLAGFGAFLVQDSSCHNDAHIVATHPAFTNSTDTTLSNWSCSTHEFFNSFPATFLPLAIAEGVTGAGSLCFTDTNGTDPTYPDCTTLCGAGRTCGIPYILARGVSPAGCGNGTVEPPEQCDDGNTVGGDGCSATCTLEAVCGNGILEPGEQCDDGNTISGDGCSATCQIELRGECPLTQGFWKNHPDAWPVTSLTLGSQTYTQAELLTILKTSVGSGKTADASLILARQLIAAKLNIANGSNPAPISSTIADADSLLSAFAGKLPYQVKPSSATGQQMINDARILDSYNNGALTPDCTP